MHTLREEDGERKAELKKGNNGWNKKAKENLKAKSRAAKACMELSPEKFLHIPEIILMLGWFKVNDQEPDQITKGLSFSSLKPAINQSKPAGWSGYSRLAETCSLVRSSLYGDNCQTGKAPSSPICLSQYHLHKYMSSPEAAAFATQNISIGLVSLVA